MCDLARGRCAAWRLQAKDQRTVQSYCGQEQVAQCVVTSFNNRFTRQRRDGPRTHLGHRRAGGVAVVWPRRGDRVLLLLRCVTIAFVADRCVGNG
jgi:hypothetical protein